MYKLVAIVGPTGIGKSGLALQLAREFSAEIIGADSRQIYKLMDIGTGKPEPRQLSEVPHHLINIIYPDRVFNLASYQHLAQNAIEDISQRDKMPILVGGSGQYIWSVVENWHIPQVEPDPKLRKELERMAEGGRTAALYQKLKNLDPGLAAKTDPNNTRRLVRAIEIASSRVQIPSERKKPLYLSLIVGLTAPRSTLYRTIDKRVDLMMEKGFAGEVGDLLETGYDPALPSMTGIGYRQLVSYFKGETELAQAVNRIKFESHRLVRMQYNWFSLQDKRIKWFDITADYFDEIKRAISEFWQQ